MSETAGAQKISDFIRKKRLLKAPAYPWQDLALTIINELNVPPYKKSAVFKVCKNNSRIFIERCLNDTKELCPTGEKWKYFFKVVAGRDQGLLN